MLSLSPIYFSLYITSLSLSLSLLFVPRTLPLSPLFSFYSLPVDNFTVSLSTNLLCFKLKKAYMWKSQRLLKKQRKKMDFYLFIYFYIEGTNQIDFAFLSTISSPQADVCAPPLTLTFSSTPSCVPNLYAQCNTPTTPSTVPFNS